MLKTALQQYFGFSQFRQGQEELIQSVLNGENTLGILPTGSGKSLCYQLPTYIKQQPTLIISPLISLMDDQVMQMKMNGERRVVSIHSGMSQSERQLAFQQLDSALFIFVSPEFILQPHHLNRIRNLTLGLIVLDEVHCLSEWGFDFRPHYALINQVTDLYQHIPVLGLTATATSHLKSDIEFVTKRTFTLLQSDMDRTNISLSVEHMTSYQDKIEWILETIATSGPTIIYVSSKKVCLDIAEQIYAAGYLTGIYHADLSYEERYTVQQQFLKNDIRIIVATSAFGMGVNKPDIRTIIHFHLSNSPSSYLQEIGRAGRDGKQSQAIALYQEDDQYLLELLATAHQIIEEDIHLFEQGTLIDQEKHDILSVLSQRYSVEKLQKIFRQNHQQKVRALQHMLQYANIQTCRRQQLMRYFNMSVKTNGNCCDICGISHQIHEKNRKKVYRKISYEEKLETLF
ncbi:MULTISPECIES: RecQ family ATP-dependent DNA helicase [unclassified Staphylococcus]|uniref:RecQ family ATP-dependent DNA helicase n=1 Tax=unclassified Staphylococcus TaxID=91994 RepID=UPI0021D0EAC4|nr:MULTISPECIES: RecQ family ATP-dependent DNA helicase [unclassified Staphylococcus]UXR79264.1 RecQ family ATP-dependent DNA helicase [Staphylococcus sp. IVB6227]UXR81516.1 RecQ family ATP-dependent DNA helicase [Staphylococcus sp. IVB6214]